MTLWLAGDVMTGRGIDQVQPHPVDPLLYEPVVRDAREYVRLAERENGPVPAPVEPAYIWGEALEEIARRRPQLRLANLETAITADGEPWPGKTVHYRMHPRHAGCLGAAGLDACTLANNHVLDWGADGLRTSLESLQAAGIRTAGAGLDAAAALAPAVLPLPGGGRLLLFAWAGPDSGVPPDWAAGAHRPGVAFLPHWGEEGADTIAAQVARTRQPGDRVVVSLHWGSNWGMGVPEEHRRCARRLVDRGAADLVFGHSSHHPRPVELYKGRLILYGCGDLINDYEGIGPEGLFDPSAVCLYFAGIDPADGALRRLEIVPMRLRRLQLVRADERTRQALAGLLVPYSASFGARLQPQPGGSLLLQA